MELLGILAIPMVVASLAWILARDTITRGEFFAQLLISAALLTAAWSWARAKTLEDVEHLSGHISEVARGTQDCCHCHSSCVDRYFFGLCKREVERCTHPHDYYWRVTVDGAGTLEDTCLRRDAVPDWFTRAREGNPAVIEHRYQNYLRADPDSLMHQGFDGEHAGSAERRAALSGHEIPPFPELHDGLFVDRVVELGVRAPPSWQAQLDELNATLGAQKQVDVTVVLGEAEGPELALAVDAAWLSGPKNGAIVVLGAPDHQTIAWARLVSVSRNVDLELGLREGLRGLPLADPEVMEVIAEEIEAKFERTPMEEFAYLAGAATPRGWWLVGLYALALLLSLGLSALFHRVDFSREGFERATRKHAREGMWMAIAAALVTFLRRRSRRH